MKPRKKTSALYPKIKPYDTGYLHVGDHHIYYEQCGNPKGKPVVFVHGGPGGGTEPDDRRFFNPRKYRIVLFHQRGSGQSMPLAHLVDNTTWHLVADMELLRKHLSIKKWQVFGGSWGSTLSIAYFIKHPTKVDELVLRGIWLNTKKEIHWLYQHGASEIFPEAWEVYLNAIPKSERGDLVKAYYKRLTSKNAKTRARAAQAWSVWEGSTSKLYPSQKLIAEFADPTFAIALARIECHYFINQGFLTHDSQLLDEVRRVSRKHNVPCTIVQGRYDMVCPITTAWDLHRAWPEAELVIVPDAGHSRTEPGIEKALVAATDKYAR